MEESRTSNTLRNVKTGIIVQFINKLMAFIVRTVFINILNSEYLGINGLFTNILSMLSFAELGIGTAIIFSMYKPISQNDTEKIKSLMKLYKICYTIIGCIVFIIGICVIPFFNVIIKDIPNIEENIILIYLLFLFNTSSSYFFTYKKSIIIAYQKQSIINNTDSIFYLIKSILEIALLVITKNYIMYLITEISTTLIENIVLAKKANKMFPFIKERNVKAISKKERNNILSNVKSLIAYKIGEVILFGTDNILISSMIDVSTVGLYSNYSLIIQSIKGILTTALGGVTASVGNLNASDDREKKKEIYYQMTFINFCIYSFCAIAFMVLLNPFIKLWVGSEYLLEISAVIVLSINVFIDGIRNPGFIFRTTLGLFSKGKISPYIAAIVNIIVSIVFCKMYGIVGIFLGTGIAQMVSYMWIDPYIIYKYEFNAPVSEYFKKLFVYTLVFIMECILTLLIANFISDDGILNFIIKTIIVVLVPNVLNIIIFHKVKEFRELKERFVYSFLNKLKGR